MSEVVSLILGVVSNFPWKYPWVGAALAIISALIGFLFVPATIFTAIILTVSIVVAVLCAVMADEDEGAATIAGIYFSIMIGSLAANFTVLPEPYKCGIERPEHAKECAQRQIDKFTDAN